MQGKEVAVAGYGNEENYEFMKSNDIEAYVEHSFFHAEQKKSYKNNAFFTPKLYSLLPTWTSNGKALNEARPEGFAEGSGSPRADLKL